MFKVMLPQSSIRWTIYSTDIALKVLQVVLPTVFIVFFYCVEVGIAANTVHGSRLGYRLVLTSLYEVPLLRHDYHMGFFL